MNFIMIPGPWQGAWIWESVVRRLHEMGHRAYPITLTGLAADAAADVSSIGLRTHINDILRAVEENDVRDAIIVAHSLSGVVGGVAADRIPERVARVVYLEAFVPRAGQAVLDAFPAPLGEEERRLIDESGGRWPVPDSSVIADGQGITPKQADWLVRHSVDHPGRPLCEPVTLSRPAARQKAVYVVCSGDHFDDALAADVEPLRAEPTWSFRTLDAGHWPMISAPDDLAALLDDVAREASLEVSRASTT
ncbi:alpha/beta hydrolase [Actinocorallia sp. A-T 12471]|uniref:alpha/beta fold hydrolase n=1 Tax=Actinocorallia sp. A-T 12471 TaxID=3089813 RepID=UPI0029D3D0DF|nr:alpha/beta hydrolase [Actinocorallia sp. A-T 12471]MDX6741601.1 alpha/beta hydrolase [Actinocorallia sp. A-T 12471]